MTTFMQNNYSWSTSVTGLINNLKLQSLQSRRFNLKVIMMYKIIHDLVSIPKDHALSHSMYLHYMHVTITPPINYLTLE